MRTPLATTKTNADASGDTTSKRKEIQLEQVTGIGGVFFKVKDPKRITAWYRTNLGIQSKGGYTDFTRALSWFDLRFQSPLQSDPSLI